MTISASLRGWGSGWPIDRSASMKNVKTKYGQVIPVHREVAPIVQFLVDETERRGYLIHKPGDIRDDWGYSNRPIGGTKKPSNHSYGLAVDIDAVKYPQGQRSKRPPQWMIDLWAKYGFEWGGAWKTNPDPMHFEFAGSITEAKHMVAMLAASFVEQKPVPIPQAAPAPVEIIEPHVWEDDMPYLMVQKKNAPETDAYWLIDGDVAVPVARESWLYIVANSDMMRQVTLDVPTARRLLTGKTIANS